jgi:hypothetical protein
MDIMIDVLTQNFETIKDKFVGKREKTINNRSEDIEDILMDKVLWLLENEREHTSENELEYINKRLRTRLEPTRNKNLNCVPYMDNFENLLIDDNQQNRDYYYKLQLLLIHYRPDAVH